MYFLVREHLKDLTKQYDKSENDLKALQSVGQVCYRNIVTNNLCLSLCSIFYDLYLIDCWRSIETTYRRKV